MLLPVSSHGLQVAIVRHGLRAALSRHLHLEVEKADVAVAVVLWVLVVSRLQCPRAYGLLRDGRGGGGHVGAGGGGGGGAALLHSPRVARRLTWLIFIKLFILTILTD